MIKLIFITFLIPLTEENNNRLMVKHVNQIICILVKCSIQSLHLYSYQLHFVCVEGVSVREGEGVNACQWGANSDDQVRRSHVCGINT